MTAEESGVPHPGSRVVGLHVRVAAVAIARRGMPAALATSSRGGGCDRPAGVAERLTVPGDFDVFGLFEVMDAKRHAEGLTWGQVNSRLAWMSKATLDRMRERGQSTCNHILPLVQWVGRTPESFTVDPGGAVHELLPDPSPGRWRWWWAHHDLAAEVGAKRLDLGLSWNGVAEAMGLGTAGAAAVAGIDNLRYGPPIGLAMIAARWVQRSAASFMSELPPAVFNPPPRSRR